VDRITVANGTRGPLTKRIQDEFFAITSGQKPDRHHWLAQSAVPAGAGVSVRS
jgi:branched-chain amino acid aminotransferase